jgi:hypothetical protein
MFAPFVSVNATVESLSGAFPPPLSAGLYEFVPVLS